MIYVACSDIPSLIKSGVLPPGFTDECVTARHQDVCIVDESCSTHLRPHSSVGPGTELKALLAGWPFRIVATADCKCTSRAAYMDAKGCDWCESPEGMAEIMGFLRESAEERGLPFLDVAGRMLVRRAIHNARKAEAKRASEEASQAAAEGPAA